jgi:hypothetical protein
MSAFQFNLYALAAAAFGYGGGRDATGFANAGVSALNGRVNVVPYRLPKENELAQARNPHVPLNDQFGQQLPPDFEGTGLLGLPVFAQVNFLAPAGWVQLHLNDPIVEISRAKKIVTTDIQGRDGSVKEFISSGDYAVTIKGILASDPTHGTEARRYPTAQVQALKELLDLPQALPVTGRLFKLFGIHNLVIIDHAWPALPGYTNLQAYELRCLSDEPIELNLNQRDPLLNTLSPF